MKISTKIVLVILLTVASIETADAQYYGYQYSGWVQNMHHSSIPFKVKKVVHQYDRYTWTKTDQFQRGHHAFLVVTLNRRKHFLELTFNRYGDVISTKRYVLRNRRGNHRFAYADSNNIVSYHNKGFFYRHQPERVTYNWDWENRKDNWKTKGKDSNGHSRGSRNHAW